MGDREVTIGELGEDISDLAVAVRELRQSIETTYVRKDVYDIAHRQLDDMVNANNARHDMAIRALEARQTLIGRTAVTALLVPIIVGVVIALVVGTLT